MSCLFDHEKVNFLECFIMVWMYVYRIHLSLSCVLG